MDEKLMLSLLQKNARMKITDLAAALDESKDDVIEKLTEIRKEKSYLWLSYNCQLGFNKYRDCDGFNTSQCQSRKRIWL